MADEKLKYQFTRISSHAEPVTLDQDGCKARQADVTVNFWTALKCVLSLKHFGGGVYQCEAGNWHCKRCHRLSLRVNKEKQC